MNLKTLNPKDKLGIKKTPFSTVPMGVVAEVGLAMFEGARKYGRHNYRAVSVDSSVYFDATMRHLTDWWEGTDIDPDSGLNHITKAIATLIVLRDAMINGNMNDDRPIRMDEGWLQELNKKATEIIEKYPEVAHVYTEKEDGKDRS